jgi:DNA-directed RNA polymerase sigma subunit (sigma70/sigma32)
MSHHKTKSVEVMRNEVHSFLAGLTPKEAQALRARFGIDTADSSADDDKEEEALRELARKLAMLKIKKP